MQFSFTITETKDMKKVHEILLETDPKVKIIPVARYQSGTIFFKSEIPWDDWRRVLLGLGIVAINHQELGA